MLTANQGAFWTPSNSRDPRANRRLWPSICLVEYFRYHLRTLQASDEVVRLFSAVFCCIQARQDVFEHADLFDIMADPREAA